MANETHHNVSIVQGDNSLRKKIGENVNMRKIFTPEKIAAGEKEIAKTKDAFADKILTELEELETLCQANFSDQENIKAMSKKAYALKGKAESLGYDLMAHILQSLCDYTEQHLNSEAYGKTIIEKHLQSVRLSAAKEYKYDRKQSDELLRHLHMLVEKYHG